MAQPTYKSAIGDSDLNVISNPHNETYDIGTSGTNRCLFVLLVLEDNPGITSITYGGVTMTQQTTHLPASANNMWVYTLTDTDGLPTGSNTLAVTLGLDTADICTMAIVYENVKQDDPIGAIIKGDGTATTLGQTITSTLTTTVADSIALTFFAIDGTDSLDDSIEPPSGSTLIYETPSLDNENKNFWVNCHYTSTPTIGGYSVGGVVNYPDIAIDNKDYLYIGFEVLSADVGGGGGSVAAPVLSQLLKLMNQ